MKRINLDTCSSTKPYDEVIKLHAKLSEEFYYNSNAMSNASYKTNNLLQASKFKIKKLLNYNEDVIFTSGATMSNNIIIQGFFKNNVNKINSCVTTLVEHPSIVNVVKNLSDDVEKFYVPYTSEHEIDFDQLESYLQDNPSLVTTCLVNNTTGLIVDYKRLYELTQKYNSFLHLDATQALCKVDFDMNYCDFMSCSMHKIRGLKGAGLIFKKLNTKLDPIIYGGGSDSCLYPGTVNVPTFATCAKTIELALQDFNNNKDEIKQMNSYLRDELSQIDCVVINTKSEKSSDYVINLSITRLGSEILLNHLELNNIIVSSGSACSSKIKSKTEGILSHYKFEHSKNNLRLCLCYDSNFDDIKYFVKIFKEGLNTL